MFTLNKSPTVAAVRGYSAHYTLENKFGSIKNRQTTLLFLGPTSGAKRKLLCWRVKPCWYLNQKGVTLCAVDILGHLRCCLSGWAWDLSWCVQTEREADFSGGIWSQKFTLILITVQIQEVRERGERLKEIHRNTWSSCWVLRSSPKKTHSTWSLHMLVVSYS